MELISDAKAAAAFINGIVPADVAARAEEERKKEEPKEDEGPADASLHLVENKE